MIAENVAAVLARIDAAAARAGRDPREITMVGVTKEVDADTAREAVAAGVADLGENRVQALADKQDALADLEVRWHLIGTLQRNKVARVVGRVAMIHSIDSAFLAGAVTRRAAELGIRQDVLLEVNAGEEPSKHGIRPGDALEVGRGLLDMDGLRLRGLMTVAPQGDAVATRRSFHVLRELRDALRGGAPDVTELSMGMTEDFEVAIEEGATIVRIGTALFGARGTKATG